jgi:hypothetical protein
MAEDSSPIAPDQRKSLWITFFAAMGGIPLIAR